MRRVIGPISVAACAIGLLSGITAFPVNAGTAPNRADKNLGIFLDKPSIHNLLWDDDWNGHNTIKKGDIHTFSKKVASSSWIDGASGYGVTSLSFRETVNASKICGTTRAPSSISTVDVITWATCMAGMPGTKVHVPIPRIPISNDLYVVYLPERTTIKDDLTIKAFTLGTTTYGPFTFVKNSSCDDYGAYHALSAYIGGLFPIAIIPAKCAKGNIDSLTEAASHEIIEAITDPIPLAGWIDNSYTNDPPDFKRFKAGEVADICSSAGAVPTAPVKKRGGYSLVPYWSNSKGKCTT